MRWSGASPGPGRLISMNMTVSQLQPAVRAAAAAVRYCRTAAAGRALAEAAEEEAVEDSVLPWRGSLP